MLRPYQKELVQGLRNSILAGNKRIILSSPTGSGKTKTFCFLVSEHLKKGGKVLIITDRIELLKQAGKDFEHIQEIKAGHEPDLTKNLMVGMIETIARRADRYHNYLKTRTMIIIDEAHRCVFTKLFPYFSDTAIVIGATATPLRTGKQDPLDDFYTDMVQVIDTPELIDLGFLSKAKTYGVDIDLKGVKKKGDDYDPSAMAQRYSENKVWEGCIENYNKICPGTKAILFASNVESSQEMSYKFSLAGIPSRHLDGSMDAAERKAILLWFKETPGSVLTSVGVLTTGFDEPTIETVILYRATMSLTLFCQMVGRGSRVIPGKKSEFFILDLGNNIKNHSFWEAPRTWSLAKKPKKDKVDAAPVKICPNCHAMLAVGLGICTFCNYEFKKEYGGKNEFADLKLLTPPEVWTKTKDKDIPTKAKLAKEKLLNAFRVLHSLQTKEEGLQFCNEMGYDKRFAYINRHRFKCFESL